MPKNKSQHFIPQHYLRQFCSESTKHICAARIFPYTFIPSASIAGQCQEDYFYREDGDLDQLLTKSESDLAPVLVDVTKNESFNQQQIDSISLLAVLLHARTKKTIQDAKLLPAHVAFDVINTGINQGHIPEPNGGFHKDMIDFKGVAGMLMTTAIPCWLEMRTLSSKLLKAERGAHFITSDNPVILLNPYFSHEKSIRSFVGFSRSGFQLILPLSPNLSVMFYDSNIYKIGSKRKRTVAITKDDVEILNSLQVQAADRCLYCHNVSMGPVIKQLVLKYTRYRRLHDKTFQVHKDDKGESELLHCKTPYLHISHPLSFCRNRRHVSVGQNRRRDPIWTQLINKLMEDLEQNPGGEDIFDRIEKIIDREYSRNKQSSMGSVS